MDEPSLKHPRLFARTRRALLAGAASAGVLFGGGMLVGSALRGPKVERISVPAARVTVQAPPPPAPVVSVNVPAPVAPTPAPVEPSIAPTPRPVTPHLWPECVVVTTTVPAKTCAWDDGFPAISADGSLIATKYFPDDGGRGNPGLSIHFLDATTGKIVHDVRILSPDEYVTLDAGGTNEKEVQRMTTKIWTRVAAVGKTLDDGRYRTLAYLGSKSSMNRGGDEPQADPPKGIYADIDNSGAARIVDPATNTVLWQYWFSGGSAPRSQDPYLDCSGWGLRSMTLWWDPKERVVVSSEAYQTGGCMCPDPSVEEVVRLPAAS